MQTTEWGVRHKRSATGEVIPCYDKRDAENVARVKNARYRVPNSPPPFEVVSRTVTPWRGQPDE